MDKSRDLRRVLSRYSGHNRINSEKKLVISELSGTRGAIFAAKSRRERQRRLSLVGRSGGGGGCEDDQGSEMGSVKSDGQDDELPSSTVSPRKLKPHKKIDEDYNGVDRASIPRKLRSVIKKRTCDTISESLAYPKNHVNGFQSTKKDCLKKPKSRVFNPEQMSKDEEEVAEALYALAGMVPRELTTLENKSDGESPSERQLHSKKLEDSPLPSEGPQSSDEAAEETSNQTSEEWSKQKMEVDDLGKSSRFSQPKLSQTTLLNLNASLQVNHQSLTKTSSGTKKNDFEEREALLLSQRVHGNTGDVASPHKREHASTEGKKNGSTSLPSPISQASRGSGADDSFPSQYSANKLPYWLHTVASSSEPGIHQSQVSHKIESEVENRSRRIKKRCATHVHITHFIQLYTQKPLGKEVSLVETHQIKPSESVTLEVLKASSLLNPVRNESTSMIPDSHICSSILRKDTLDAYNDTNMTLGRCEQASLAPGKSTKRCFDFLSLSTAGGSGTEPKVDPNRNRMKLDPLAGLPVPQLQHLTRYESAASLPLPPNLIHLNAYQNLHSTSARPPIPQVHLQQLPPYFSRSNQLDSSVTNITKQPQLQPQPPQQHSVWMTQPAAQYMTGAMAPSQIAHWQNSRQEPQIVQYTQAQLLPSQSSLPSGTHFPKYLQMPQQNHQMLRNSAPFPPIQTNSQHSPHPICCDKSGS